MHILHVTPRYLPAQGGAERYIAELSERFVLKGHRVTVLTSTALQFEYLWDRSAKSIELQVEEINGVEVHRFPLRHLPGSPLSYHMIRRLVWWLGRLAPNGGLLPFSKRLSLAAPRLVDQVDTLRKELSATVDVVGGLNIGYEGLLMSAAQEAKSKALPFINYPLTHLGAGPTPGSDERAQFYTMPQQVSLTVDHADGLVSMTDAEKNFYVDRGFPEQNAVVAGPGLYPEEVIGGVPDLVRQRLDISGPIVLALGTLSFDKGAIHTLEAMRKVVARHPDVTLILAGHMTAEVSQYLEEMSLEEAPFLRVLGSVSEDEKRNLLAAASILVVPSRIDSFGIVYLEAWANRVPVVAADCWGVTDIVQDRVNGRVVPFGDVKRLSDVISKLIEMPEERQRLGENGYHSLYTFHRWDQKVEAVADFYQRCIETNRIRTRGRG